MLHICFVYHDSTKPTRQQNNMSDCRKTAAADEKASSSYH